MSFLPFSFVMTEKPDICTVNPLYTDIRYNDKIRLMIFDYETFAQEIKVNQKLCDNTVFNTSRNICFGYFLELSH